MAFHLSLEQVEREQARDALRELVARARQGLLIQLLPALVEQCVRTGAAQMEHRHYGHVAHLGFGGVLLDREHMGHGALDGVFFHIHDNRLQAGHLGSGHALGHTLGHRCRHAHADPALRFGRTDHDIVEIDVL